MRIFPDNLCSVLELRFGGEGLIGDEDERPKGSHVPSTASKLIYTFNRTFNRVITIAVLLLLQCLATVHGSWIDPSTPEGFHSILVPHPHQYFAPRHPNKEKKKVPESGSPTESPTESPTMQPTPMPPFHSKAPTQSPTYAPTATPTPDAKPFVSFDLVMSDEFDVDSRTFQDGVDPMWTALNKNDYTNNALHFYGDDHAFTKDGHLNIRTSATKTEVVGFNDLTLKKQHDVKYFKSAMLQSWNKFCFTGGLIEAEVVLPGRSDVGGLWPAFWLLGNLARHTYVGSSNNIWPWSQTACDPKHIDAQKLSACLKTSHYGMTQGVGRGAPEIDIFEVQPGPVKHNTEQFGQMSVGQPFASHSLQVAPGKSFKRPGPGNWPGPGEWYENPKLKFGPESCLNIAFYGTYNHFAAAPSTSYDYWSDAISQNRQLSEKHFTGGHKFKLHWEPPSEMHGDGFINWYIDDDLILGINGTSIKGPEGAEIPSEPSYILLNTAISKDWGFPKTCPEGCSCKDYDCESAEWEKTCGFSPGFCDMLKATEEGYDEPGANYKVNYIRLYQDKENPVHKVGCSTPERPTRRWIEGNAKSYTREEDTVPLKKVPRGGGKCDVESIDACGGDYFGLCESGRCLCQPGRTGPHCLSVDGHDDVIWDIQDKVEDLRITAPVTAAPFVILTSIIVAGALAVFWEGRQRRRRNKNGYEEIIEIAGGDDDAEKI